MSDGKKHKIDVFICYVNGFNPATRSFVNVKGPNVTLDILINDPLDLFIVFGSSIMPHSVGTDVEAILGQLAHC